MFIADEWAVAVAIGGNERVKFASRGPVASQHDVFRADGFGVHRNEFFRATQRRDFRAKMRKNFHQHIASDGGMLINADAHAFQRVVAEEIQVAHGVIFTGLGRNFVRRFCRCEISIRAKERVVQFHNLAAHAFFIRLQNFAAAFVELDAVAVVGNVAARDHDRRNFIFKSEQRHGGRRGFSAIHRAITQIIRRTADGFHHAACAGPEIAANRDAFARALDFANGFKVLEKAFGVGVADGIGHGRSKTTRAAGAERHAALDHKFLDGNLHVIKVERKQTNASPNRNK